MQWWWVSHVMWWVSHAMVLGESYGGWVSHEIGPGPPPPIHAWYSPSKCWSSRSPPTAERVPSMHVQSPHLPPLAGSTQAAAAGKADNAYAALVPPGSVVPVDTPVDMEKPRSDNGTDEFFYNALCKGIENEKMLNRLRAATSPPWEEPAGEPDYAEPMYTGRRQRRGTPLYSAPPEYTTCDQDPDDAEYAEVDGSLDGSLVS